MTTKELLTRPEHFTERKETDFGERELLEIMDTDDVFVVATLFDWDPIRRGARVYFGKGLIGFIPEKEFTTEILKYKMFSEIPNQILYLMGKNIVAQVLDFNISRREFLLSRKRSMIEAKKMLYTEKIVYSSIVAILKSKILVDVGAGNIASITWKEFSKVPYDDFSKTGFQECDMLKVSIIRMENNEIEASRRYCCPSYEEVKDSYRSYIGKEELLGTITGIRKINPEEDFYIHSYWIEIEPNVSGILDTDMRLPIGKTVDLKVISVKDTGLKLRLAK